MIDWLLDIAHNYVNRSRVFIVCKAMLCIMVVPILVAVLLLFRQEYEYNISLIIGITDICHILYDFGFVFVCLALLGLLYDNNYKMPTIGYYIVVLVIKGACQILMPNNKAQGEIFTLIFILSFVLHIIVGVQLLKTKYSVFGRAFLYYLGGILLAAVLDTLHADLQLSVIAIILACMVPAYIFYKELPFYYK